VIPGGDPADVAKTLLEAVCPDAPAVLAGRIDRLAAEIEQQVEEYRLNLKGTFGEFIELASRRVKLRRALEARAGRPAAGPLAAEVLALVTSVRRWRPAEEFRRERARRLEAIRGELADVEASIRYVLESAKAGGGFATSDPAASAAGLAHDHDEVLRRLTKGLEVRQALRDRLARLDAHGDGGRSQAVHAAVEATGGFDALVEALAPTMPAPAADALAKLRRDMDGLAGQLASIDPETRLAAELVARLAGLDAQIPALQSTVKQQKTDAAGALVAAAIAAGTLPAVQALESAVRSIRPGLAEALGGIRGDDDALLAVVEELIADRK
jgi:hypothetical protein